MEVTRAGSRRGLPRRRAPVKWRCISTPHVPGRELRAAAPPTSWASSCLGTGTPLPGGSSGVTVPTPKGVGRKGGCKELAPTHNMHPAERDAGEGLRHRAAAGTLPLAGVRVGRRTKHGGSGRVQEDDYFVLLTFSQFLACSVVLLLAYATGRDLRACGVARPAGAAPGYSG